MAKDGSIKYYYYEANRLATSCSNKSDIVATCYEQPVLVLLEQLVASLLPSSTL